MGEQLQQLRWCLKQQQPIRNGSFIWPILWWWWRRLKRDSTWLVLNGLFYTLWCGPVIRHCCGSVLFTALAEAYFYLLFLVCVMWCSCSLASYNCFLLMFVCYLLLFRITKKPPLQRIQSSQWENANQARATLPLHRAKGMSVSFRDGSWN